MHYVLLLILLFAATVVFAHGGKAHDMGEFTHLAAELRATLDRLGTSLGIAQALEVQRGDPARPFGDGTAADLDVVIVDDLPATAWPASQPKAPRRASPPTWPSQTCR